MAPLKNIIALGDVRLDDLGHRRALHLVLGLVSHVVEESSLERNELRHFQRVNVASHCQVLGGKSAAFPNSLPHRVRDLHAERDVFGLRVEVRPCPSPVQ